MHKTMKIYSENCEYAQGQKYACALLLIKLIKPHVHLNLFYKSHSEYRCTSLISTLLTKVDVAMPVTEITDAALPLTTAKNNV